MNTTPQIADHADLAHTPEFFKPEKAYKNFTPNLNETYQEGIAFARQRGLEPAHKLIAKGQGHAAMLTDLQDDFRPKGRLPVQGTDNVTLRTCVRLINGTVTPHFAGVIFSLDGHPIQHISFDHYWRDDKGNPLDLSQHDGAACLTLADKDKYVFKAYGFNANGPYDIGYYQPRFDSREAVPYWKHLQATGQGDIWVFVPHCAIGTDGVNLHPLLAETIAFMSGALSFQPTIVHKGHISGTDWFGPLEPCRPDPNHPQGGFQKPILDTMKRFKTVELRTEAGRIGQGIQEPIPPHDASHEPGKRQQGHQRGENHRGRPGLSHRGRR